MPAKSKKQFKFMKAVESGYIKHKGLSRKKAKEFTKNQSFGELPEVSESYKKISLRDHRREFKKRFPRG